MHSFAQQSTTEALHHVRLLQHSVIRPTIAGVPQMVRKVDSTPTLSAARLVGREWRRRDAREGPQQPLPPRVTCL
jgi:hypothetical protein